MLSVGDQVKVDLYVDADVLECIEAADVDRCAQVVVALDNCGILVLQWV